MNTSDRQNDIVALIRERGLLGIDLLAEHFAVTPQTIRRDVNALCDANILRRRHGGAELLQAATNSPYDSRRITNLAAKRRVGAAVAGLIPNHASVMLGIGTTPEQVALALTGHDDLTVITNNLNVAMALSANRSNRVVIAGGTLRLPDRDLLGPEAEALFRGYRADFGVFGVGGIDADGTLLDFDRAEVAAREALRESCRHAILVADRSKFGRPAPAHGGALSSADTLVLDAAPPPALAALAEAAGVRLVLPEGEIAA
ncbi:DeoR/GlpR family DNA-binding transcription regulator [Oceanicella sp. SM1341]|uniref:DeoR/GlpR family DNA-binding transcription regulator n=1 Tax=Oceanicella sp. SM1341 TaxID=1548889 RepID=UPI000E554810|nr:DeoR/GlpR family DNA-binding transcription regulator [Oceanicella sp. SM1341]